MLVKNTTPFVHAAKVCSRKPPRPDMTFVVKGSFTLAPGKLLEPLPDQPPLSAELFAEEDTERAGECLYPGDFADLKGNAEVMLRGWCYPPGGRPAAEAIARFSVGSWSKELRVFGPRAWSEGLVSRATEPRPFARVELSFANAFGGPDFAANPVGRGWKTREAPAVERPGEPLRPDSRPVPASFAPINPLWPPRAGKLGTRYGAAWRAERAPYYADDFDWSHFQAAPADQQLEGFLRGDEEIVLQGFQRQPSVVRGRLPSLRIRVFVKDVEAKIREVTMNLDTLFVDSEASVVTLTWRGLLPVREHDLLDVKTVLVVSEPLAGDPRPASHYHAQLEAFEDDPVGLKAMMPPGIEDFAERDRLRRAGIDAPVDPATKGMDPVSAMMRQALGTFAQAEQKQVATQMAAIGPLPPQAAEELARPRPKAAPQPPVPVIKKPGKLPPLGLRKVVRGIMDQLAKVKDAMGQGQGEQRPDVLAQIAELEKLPEHPVLAKLDPSYSPPGPLSTDAPGPHANLVERDLSGLDLQGMDLRGANLEDALLVGTNLRGARLGGANLRRAVLYRADLTEADLGGADLTEANLAEVQASGASFREANLEMAFFAQAVLRLADLGGAKGSYTSFVGADLSGVKAAKAVFDRADFEEASIEDAELAGSTFTACSFEKVRGARVDLSRAVLHRSRFPEAQLTGARLSEVRAHRTFWTGAVLDKADLSDAWITSSFLIDVSAVGARLVRANLRRSRLLRANLTRAELIDANLFEADLGRARLEKTLFTRAHLFGASLHQAAGVGADFTGADLRRSTLAALP